ncbi:tetraacyldisaccharide 4'-kinase [Dysgonomonas sp. 25]|uniref:tetraacyldisaccharide 4'-kinase n=1 Tax=Dysgonomonas sp. 25 TaxID=2302933 RepID=UPI0013CFE249|nr:tetraacyldisaccharide 4'-kinase [Dysgonomonas sp. 25]NDV69415.1 tetraacyldisaccharide 4'-kinase [Dysgonomonas sp. 25]
MNKQSVHINWWLLPISWLYGLVVCIRNKFFKWGILKRETFDVPVICIGNITVGGTGKTPHTEYLVRILRDKYRIAVLSRGYGRKTKGFILADDKSTSRQIGDEPLQIKQKFPDIMVAVDAKRTRGIKNLLALEKPPEVILLDDAFQHRYVKPSYTIILTNYNRPAYLDKLLPAGRLRESFGHIYKANMIVVTKCPDDLKPIDYRLMMHEINPYPFQSVFFTRFAYKQLVPVFVKKKDTLPLPSLKGMDVLLVTGIASPATMIKELQHYTSKIHEMTYPDHYVFKNKDIKKIKERFDAIQSDNKIIITTEKDATRLVLFDEMDKELKKSLYYLPIEVSFVENEQLFRDKILEHIKAKRISVSL